VVFLSCIALPCLVNLCPPDHVSLFGHIAWMPDQTDAKKILTASLLENWRRPPGRPHTTWMKTIHSRTWNPITSLNEANSNWRCWESSTLETDVYVWRYALLVVHDREEEEEEEDWGILPCSILACFLLSVTNSFAAVVNTPPPLATVALNTMSFYWRISTICNNTLCNLSLHWRAFDATHHQCLWLAAVSHVTKQ